jgi:hypothetical protein
MVFRIRRGETSKIRPEGLALSTNGDGSQISRIQKGETCFQKATHCASEADRPTDRHRS